VSSRAAQAKYILGISGALATAMFGPAAGAVTPPKLPSWVKPGLVLQYAEDLGGYVNYDYTDTVTSVSNGVVDVTTYRWSPGVPGTASTTHWSCSAVCTGLPASLSAQFWVDPGDPVASLKGGPWAYRYMGTQDFPLKGKTWRTGLLYFPSAHGPIVTYFQASTGLVLYHKEYAYSLQYHVWYTIQLYYRGTSAI
jgi:hypothetical protein